MKQRYEILAATLKHVPFDGWTLSALEAGAKDCGYKREYAEIVFSGGVEEALDMYAREADKVFEEEAKKLDLDAMSVTERIAELVKLRINQYDKQIAKQAMAYYAFGGKRQVAASKSLYKTIDTIWYIAGDRSTDYNFYTKRLSLAGAYSSTLVYWFKDTSRDSKESWEFLSRRIDNILQFGRCVKWLQSRLPKVPVKGSAPLHSQGNLAQ